MRERERDRIPLESREIRRKMRRGLQKIRRKEERMKSENVDRVGQSRSRSSFWHTIRSRSRSRSGLGPPQSRSDTVSTSVSLDHKYAYLKKDNYINVH